MTQRGLVFTALALVGLLLSVAGGCARAEAPEEVAAAYGAAVYARDFAAAYNLISEADQEFRAKEEYLRENAPFAGLELEMARKLASFIQFSEVRTDIQGHRATVTTYLRLPDGNSPVAEELFSRAAEGNLAQGERRDLLAQLQRHYESGRIPVIEAEETFTLVKEGGQWRILLNWAERTVAVSFSGQVKEGLLWSFDPLQEIVWAPPGQTLRAVYRAKNLSDRQITAKAIHTITPAEATDFLEVIQCFCFFQLTLDPGEEQDLPFVFRVRWDVPGEVKAFHSHYDFYPIEAFPKGGKDES